VKLLKDYHWKINDKIAHDEPIDEEMMNAKPIAQDNF